jgi:hypothetical protein
MGIFFLGGDAGDGFFFLWLCWGWILLFIYLFFGTWGWILLFFLVVVLGKETWH